MCLEQVLLMSQNLISIRIWELNPWLNNVLKEGNATIKHQVVYTFCWLTVYTLNVSKSIHVYYENQLLIIDTTIFYVANILRVFSYTHFINTHFWISWYTENKKISMNCVGLLKSGFPAKINVNMICHVDWVLIHTKDARTFRVLIVDTNIKIFEIINTVKA